MDKDIYIKEEWPEIQEFMEDKDYAEKVYYDCEKDVWFVPKEMYERHYKKKE